MGSGMKAQIGFMPSRPVILVLEPHNWAKALRNTLVPRAVAFRFNGLDSMLSPHPGQLLWMSFKLHVSIGEN